MTSHYHSGSTSGGFYNHIKVKTSNDQPNDTVQDLCLDPFNSSQHGFLTGGWDGILRYGRIKGTGNQEVQIPFKIFLEHPIVSVTIGRNNIAFAGLTTGDIIAVDMPNNQCQLIGTHQASPICKLFWVDNFNILISFGFDQKMKFWNLANDNGNFLAQDYNLPFKTHTVAYDYPYVLIGTAQGKIGFLNLSTLPNLKIPSQNVWFDVVEFGSKYTCSTIKATAKLYALGCADGRVAMNTFKDSYNGIQPVNQGSKKMYSKSQKKQSGYNHSPQYGQVNDIDIGFENNYEYLVISGSEQISFFNLMKREKARRIKIRGTVGKISLDGKYFIFAEGNDWLEGMSEWKKPFRPKIEAVKFSRSELEEIIKK